MTKETFLKKIKSELGKKQEFNLNKMVRPLNNEDVLSSLMPNNCSSAEDYLFRMRKFTTIDIINELDKLLLNETMNPHSPEYSPKKYFVDGEGSDSTLRELNNLCTTNVDEMSLFRLAQYQRPILHFGEKGGGKTLVQNIWLYDNNDWFEDNNIIWIRCDAHKLYELWKRQHILRLASIDDYLYGQLVYVFSKYFKKSKFCKDGKESNLFSNIYKELKNHTYNTEPHKDSWYTDKNVYKSDAREGKFSSALHMYQAEKIKKTRKLGSITDWIVKFHQDIVTNVQENKKDYSLWTEILGESQLKEEGSNRVKNLWVLVGRWIEHFIINVSPTNYYFLQIVDGIDNTPLDNATNVELYKTMLMHLLKVVSTKDPSQRIIRYISFRNRSQRDAALILINEDCFNSDILRKCDSLKKCEKIDHKVPDDFREIIKKRIKIAIESVIEKYKDSRYEGDIAITVFKTLLNSQDLLIFRSFKDWHSNVRCFTFNILHLIEIVCFRYYLRGEPSRFNIRQQLKTFEKINLLLNGRLHLDSYVDPANNFGDSFFNLFFHYSAEDEKPIHLIYTRILQIILNRDKSNISEFETINLLSGLFGYSENDLQECLLKLRAYGIIDSRLKRRHLKHLKDPDTKKIVYFKNKKTELCLSFFFNDIEYLYNCCLDCEIPVDVKYFNHKISATEKSFFAPSIIKTSISFVKFIKYLDAQELDGKDSEYKKVFDVNNLINIDNLLDSFDSKLDLVFQDPDYIEDLDNYFG